MTSSRPWPANRHCRGNERRNHRAAPARGHARRAPRKPRHGPHPGRSSRRGPPSSPGPDVSAGRRHQDRRTNPHRSRRERLPHRRAPGLLRRTRPRHPAIRVLHPRRPLLQSGNKVLKRTLFLSAFAALHDPPSRAYYDRKRPKENATTKHSSPSHDAAPTSSTPCSATAPSTNPQHPKPLDKKHRGTLTSRGLPANPLSPALESREVHATRKGNDEARGLARIGFAHTAGSGRRGDRGGDPTRPLGHPSGRSPRSGQSTRAGLRERWAQA